MAPPVKFENQAGRRLNSDILDPARFSGGRKKNADRLHPPALEYHGSPKDQYSGIPCDGRRPVCLSGRKDYHSAGKFIQNPGPPAKNIRHDRSGLPLKQICFQLLIYIENRSRDGIGGVFDFFTLPFEHEIGCRSGPRIVQGVVEPRRVVGEGAGFNFSHFA